jgi:hypothetical protein
MYQRWQKVRAPIYETRFWLYETVFSAHEIFLDDLILIIIEDKEESSLF